MIYNYMLIIMLVMQSGGVTIHTELMRGAEACATAATRIERAVNVPSKAQRVKVYTTCIRRK